MSHIWEGTWQSKCFLRFDSRNLVKVKPWKKYPGLLICIMKRWLVSPRRVGKAEEEPRT